MSKYFIKIGKHSHPKTSHPWKHYNSMMFEGAPKAVVYQVGDWKAITGASHSKRLTRGKI